MTLVLSCLTNRYAIQVSDRRISRLSGGQVLEDTRNKGTVYCAQMSFAYSGLAEIEGQPTDEWLAYILGSAPTLNDAMPILRDKATRVFARANSLNTKKRHAFIGAGWGQPSWATRLVPGFVVITNALDDNWSWLPSADSQFRIDGLGIGTDRKFLLCPPIGAHVDVVILENLRRNISRCISHKTGPLEIVRLLGETIRRVASYTSSVGMSLLATVLPRDAALNDFAVFTTPLTPEAMRVIDTAMFFHIPSGSHDLNWNTPNFVCNGFISTQGEFIRN